MALRTSCIIFHCSIFISNTLELGGINLLKYLVFTMFIWMIILTWHSVAHARPARDKRDTVKKQYWWLCQLWTLLRTHIKFDSYTPSGDQPMGEQEMIIRRVHWLCLMALRVRVVFASIAHAVQSRYMGGTGASIIFAGICSMLLNIFLKGRQIYFWVEK